jgi:NTE family protein
MISGRTAFVLGGGGVLGAVEVGMLQALMESGIQPDIVVGTSVGALNGALVAHDPRPEVVTELRAMWHTAFSDGRIYGEGRLGQLRRAARTGTHLHSAQGLRDALQHVLGDARFEDLPVHFECCAASIERAAEHWFNSGSVVDAVVASAAVPGLLPPAEVNGEHFLDGGIVNSIPVGHAAALGAERLFVLQVGRIDRPLQVPKRPWEVARVSFEIARRHRFAREMAALPTGVKAYVLPTGAGSSRDDSLLAYRDFAGVSGRIEQARAASLDYLKTHSPDRL